MSGVVGETASARVDLGLAGVFAFGLVESLRVSWFQTRFLASSIAFFDPHVTVHPWWAGATLLPLGWTILGGLLLAGVAAPLVDRTFSPIAIQRWLATMGRASWWLVGGTCALTLTLVPGEASGLSSGVLGWVGIAGWWLGWLGAVGSLRRASVIPGEASRARRWLPVLFGGAVLALVALPSIGWLRLVFQPRGLIV